MRASEQATSPHSAHLAKQSRTAKNTVCAQKHKKATKNGGFAVTAKWGSRRLGLNATLIPLRHRDCLKKIQLLIARVQRINQKNPGEITRCVVPPRCSADKGV
jgi:hypothetical protein